MWNRALSSDEAAQVFNTTLPKASMIHRGLLGHWRPLDAKLDEPDGRLVVPNTIAARSNGQARRSPPCSLSSPIVRPGPPAPCSSCGPWSRGPAGRGRQ